MINQVKISLIIILKFKKLDYDETEIQIFSRQLICYEPKKALYINHFRLDRGGTVIRIEESLNFPHFLGNGKLQ
ncbi:hypothetical protein A5893_13075 [Pedobacter psychrophilus]|uniref:Uncharacterized protein n=1 Tax=Pedobacter psychrophilus TaxID=1826909 RepID=A0A179DDI5_9SPHI|nr:hypothetical protein [Pedobacter psychrophilus]OAQ38964.1 hypothetical protein A5893_13075 [Pedobacter psychrophilus]